MRYHVPYLSQLTLQFYRLQDVFQSEAYGVHIPSFTFCDTAVNFPERRLLFICPFVLRDSSMNCMVSSASVEISQICSVPQRSPFSVEAVPSFRYWGVSPLAEIWRKPGGCRETLSVLGGDEAEITPSLIASRSHRRSVKESWHCKVSFDTTDAKMELVRL